MKIILLEDIKKQGKKGQIKEVKDGYGKFLIENKKAVLQTKGSIDVLSKQTKEEANEEAKEIKKAKQNKNKIEKLTLIFNVKTGKNDMVFGSISSKQILTELSKKEMKIDKHSINIKTPINTLGTTTVEIKLHKKVTAELKVRLVKE